MQEMTYKEREHLKAFDFGEQAADVVVMIAHWHRQERPVKFSDYAANWARAEKRRDVSKLREAWPHAGIIMIRDNHSDWRFDVA